jgi:polyisoprenoid-binding protein YceI
MLAMRTFLTAFTLLVSTPALADAVAVSAGTIQLVQIKNETAPVAATIAGVTGSVDLAAGTGELTIPVRVWTSGLEIRDNNVRDTFFGAVEHPTATFTLSSLALTDGAGQAKGTLALYSGSVPVEAAVKVSTDADGTTKVETTTPFSVSIAALGLSESLVALMKLCSHASVNDAVEVSVTLTLAKE